MTPGWGASIGIALHPDDGAMHRLLAAADAAMHAAKRRGGVQAMFFTAQMEANAKAQTKLHCGLHLALDDPGGNALSLHYQVKVCTGTGPVSRAPRPCCTGAIRSLSIDNFGTAYSSLAYLRCLPARQIKIDRSFVKDLHPDHDARAIVAAVVGLAHGLGLTVVAEGVDLASQRDLLQGLCCDELQGSPFARPVPAADLLRWVRGPWLPGRPAVPAAGVQPRGPAHSRTDALPACA